MAEFDSPLLHNSYPPPRLMLNSHLQISRVPDPLLTLRAARLPVLLLLVRVLTIYACRFPRHSILILIMIWRVRKAGALSRLLKSILSFGDKSALTLLGGREIGLVRVFAVAVAVVAVAICVEFVWV